MSESGDGVFLTLDRLRFFFECDKGRLGWKATAMLHTEQILELVRPVSSSSLRYILHGAADCMEVDAGDRKKLVDVDKGAADCKKLVGGTDEGTCSEASFSVCIMAVKKTATQNDGCDK